MVATVKKAAKWVNARMSEPNPEGVTGWDALFMTVFPVAVFLLFANVFVYFNNHPEAVEAVRKVLFRLASYK